MLPPGPDVMGSSHSHRGVRGLQLLVGQQERSEQLQEGAPGDLPAWPLPAHLAPHLSLWQPPRPHLGHCSASLCGLHPRFAADAQHEEQDEQEAGVAGPEENPNGHHPLHHWPGGAGQVMTSQTRDQPQQPGNHRDRKAHTHTGISSAIPQQYSSSKVALPEFVCG